MEKKIFNVHPDVVKLGTVSFLTDISSEAIFAVFSVFFTVVVGAPASLLGLIEGFSDFSASSLDYFSGWLSDKIGKRKPPGTHWVYILNNSKNNTFNWHVSCVPCFI